MSETREPARPAEELEQDLSPPEEGCGQLLQRDYWGVLHECRLGPQQIAALVRERFVEFPPPELVRFHRVDGTSAPLEVGDELEVDIRMAGTFLVRIVHVDANSLTIGTVKGHPEAGRITFGAYRNARRDVVFHIRSVARSGSRLALIGFRTIGEAMQTNTWTDFINRVAAAADTHVLGDIHADTEELEDAQLPSDDDVDPTFIARGE